MRHALLAALALSGRSAAAPVTPAIRAMIELTDLSSVAVSPDGRTVVFRAETASIERNDYDLAWYVVPSDASAPPRRLAGAGEGDWPDGTLFAQPPSWSPDGCFVYYRALIDGEVEVWRAALDRSRTEQVTHDAADVTGFALTQDGRSVVYSAGATREDIGRAEQAEYDSGVRIDAHVDPSRPLYRGSRINGRLASERLNGFWFAHGGLLADTPAHFRAVETATLTPRDASPSEAALVKPPAKPFDTIDGRQILARADGQQGQGTAYLLASGVHGALVVTRGVSTKDAIRCSRSQCRDQTILTAAWQRGAERIVFTTTDGSGNDALHVWDIGSGAVTTIAAGQGVLNGGRDGTQGCAVAQDAVVCVSAAANVPPRLVRIDLATGRQTVLADPNAGLLPAGAPLFERLRWTDRNHVAFTGQLLLPANRSGAAPLFLTYYVCDGFLRGGTGDEFPLRSLAAHGIAALCVNRPPAEPGFGDQLEQYRIAQSGLESAVELLARRGVVDPGRVGMGGLSFGGEVTAWMLAHTNLLAAASVSSTLLTPTYYWFNALAGRDTPKILQQVWKLGDPDVDAARWKAVSPALETAAIHAPLLMQLPEQEYRFNVELAARMARTGTPVELWAFPNETHVKYQPRHKLAVYQRNLDWFRYWLTGAADPDAAASSQNMRWRAFDKKPGWHDAASPASQGSPSQERSHSSTSASVSTP